VDLSVEGTHYRRQWLSLEEIGWRAAAGALSDLAAAGAEAIGVLASVGVPRDAPAEDVVTLMEGVGAATASVGGVVLGGDLAAAPFWLVDVTVLGRVARPVTRGGRDRRQRVGLGTARLCPGRTRCHAARCGTAGRGA